MTAFDHFPADADAMAYAVEVHRRHPVPTWGAILADVPERYRAEVEVYLRSVAHRMRTQRRIKGDRRK